MNFSKIELEIPMVLILFVLIGIFSAFFLSNLYHEDNKKVNVKDIFKSCEKIGYFYHDEKVIKCEIK